MGFREGGGRYFILLLCSQLSFCCFELSMNPFHDDPKKVRLVDDVSIFDFVLGGA